MHSIRYFQMSYLRHQRYHGFLRFDTLPYRLDQVFQMSYLRYQRYPSILRFRYLTIPARSGIFKCDTHYTDAYRGMEYPGYLPGFQYPTRCTTPVFFFFQRKTNDRKLSEQVTCSFQNVPNFPPIFYPGKYPARCTTQGVPCCWGLRYYR